METEFALEGADPEEAWILWHFCAIAQPKQVQPIIKLTHGDPVWEETRGGLLQEDLPRISIVAMISHCSVKCAAASRRYTLHATQR
ncbi:hypothetical protein KSX_00200 [Ktedonospora formicarum]|uniref:Uncharacterized protein n=1 Tax=Ktedonospora formicarum TaxID=2778364 RepID=A0A8J3HWA4_9CHLR|nr:hypothetical protein KSX_00200 [Ktedonospora formicarum]